ncbi:MAG: beta-ketoacyl-[acyl-carrier-protein] synthase family protein [Thermodesulfobacteriota bacterium]
MTHNKSDIVITGMGCCCSAGPNARQSWQTILEHRANCGAAPVEVHSDKLDSPVFDANGRSLVLPPPLTMGRDEDHPDLARLNPTLLLALEALAEGLKQAGLVPEELAGKRVGVALGTTIGCIFHDNRFYVDWKEGKQQDPASILNYLSTNLATRFQQILAVNGPHCVVTNACASGTDSIGLVKQWLEQDLCDIGIGGGSDELALIARHGFAGLMLTSKTPCRPFDVNRDGLNLGEGAGILVMESRDHADSRNAQPLGRVRGFGNGNDAYHPTAPHPEGLGLQHALTSAMADGEVEAAEIGFINAHGTGTRANDSAEMAGLHGTGLDHCTVVSTKGATGHTLGGAGGIEAVLTLMALREGQTSGTIGCREPDPAFAFSPLTQGESVTLDKSMGISQSLAFGGGNSVLVLEAYRS